MLKVVTVMKMNNMRLNQTYLDVLQEYNSSTYAKDKEIATVPPDRRHLLVARKIIRKLDNHGVVLDIGTGRGIMPRLFQRLGFKVISVDFAGTGGKYALKRLIDLGIEGHYVQVGSESLPMLDNSVDVVYAGDVIEHLPHTPKYFMSDIRRVLKKGGYCIIDTKNAVELKARLKMLLGISNWPCLESIYRNDYNIHHHKEYTATELEKLFKLSEFHNIQTYSFETFFFKSLKTFKSFRAMGASKGKQSIFGSGFNFLHPYEYLRLVFLIFVMVFPHTRSNLLSMGQK